MTERKGVKRHIGVFINPIGGRRRAEIIFETKLKPKLEMVGISYEKLVTTIPTYMEEYL